MRILLIEDDEKLANSLIRALAQSGHACDHAGNGRTARAAAVAASYDAIILDRGLPDIDGLELLAWLRRNRIGVPVLILTAHDGIDDRIHGLDLGADDYLVKPFALGELEARLRAISRRAVGNTAPIEVGRLQWDPSSRQISVGDKLLDLTARELSLLELLLQRPGRIVSKQTLFDALYSWDAEANPSVIEVHTSRLRRKLENADAGLGIRMLRGLGYRIEIMTDD
ncbi:MAG: response regulator [Xanthomonadaceae bacterium]|jgi:DNA-binding response OmpR family regulator|nr:response regulator [Xanthomonadaceae bacterium]